jgi:hypothetical protein
LTPGEIRVGEVVLVLDEPHVKVWHVDLLSKYAEVASYSGDDVIMLAAGTHTLRSDESRPGELTVIKLGLDDGWTVIAEAARYTLRIVAYRLDPGAEVRVEQVITD